MSEHEQLRRSWIANAAAWRDAVREQRIESRRVTDAALVQAVLDLAPRTVLDLGCGEGWLARALAPHGISVTGVDASPPLIESAQALGGGTFFVAAYDELPRTPFDAVVANFSVLDDRELSLPPAESLIVQTVHPAFAGGAYADGWRVETFDSFGGHWPESMPWYFRTLASWSGVLARAGYAIAEIREPMHPERGVPASILFVTRRAAL
jgi:SAM-dependent methyltransferase